jgi:hypothetical protein
MEATLHRFEEENRIKEAMNIQQFINPEAEGVEDPVDQEDLVEAIAASYSLTPEDSPDDELDQAVRIRPGQALSAIDIVRRWEEGADDSSHEVIRQIQAIEKRMERVQVAGLQQRTIASYFAQ